jgi:hypothetical protein
MPRTQKSVQTFPTIKLNETLSQGKPLVHGNCNDLVWHIDDYYRGSSFIAPFTRSNSGFSPSILFWFAGAFEWTKCKNAEKLVAGEFPLGSMKSGFGPFSRIFLARHRVVP